MARVVIEQLSKIFKGPKGETIRAVNDISLTVEDGEFLVLVGPSGCGKSTTLRIIAGLEEATSGTIAIDGKVINGIAPKDRDIAMVFQNFALYPHMTVYENMAFGLKLRKLARAEIEERLGRAAEILGLQDCLGRKPAELSGGQRQRVAVGRAIVRQPKVFLFDEPLSNLDAQMRVQMRREISALHARLGITSIFVTHDQVEAMTMGDRIVVMKDGNIQQAAKPMELYRQPANMFVGGFIGSPAMNFFRGTLVKREGGLFFQERVAAGMVASGSQNSEAPHPGPLPAHSSRGEGEEKKAPGFVVRVENAMAARLAEYCGREIVLGIRPENVSDKAGASGAFVESVAEGIEPLGAETYLYAASGGHEFAARIQGMPKPGEKVSLVFDMSAAHFFDPDSERAILGSA